MTLDLAARLPSQVAPLAGELFHFFRISEPEIREMLADDRDVPTVPPQTAGIHWSVRQNCRH